LKDELERIGLRPLIVSMADEERDVKLDAEEKQGLNEPLLAHAFEIIGDVKIQADRTVTSLRNIQAL
jgi:hypothetical protein